MDAEKSFGMIRGIFAVEFFSPIFYRRNSKETSNSNILRAGLLSSIIRIYNSSHLLFLVKSTRSVQKRSTKPQAKIAPAARIAI